jgi:hypothetical protein
VRLSLHEDVSYLCIVPTSRLGRGPPGILRSVLQVRLSYLFTPARVVCPRRRITDSRQIVVWRALHPWLVTSSIPGASYNTASKLIVNGVRLKLGDQHRKLLWPDVITSQEVSRGMK